jgi:uncharacterized membrane protein
MEEYMITAPYFRIRLLLSGVILLLIYTVLAEFKLLHLGLAEMTKIEDSWDEITALRKFVKNTLMPIVVHSYFQG